MPNSPRAIQGTTVPEPGYHNRQPVLATKIRNLFCSLSPSTYDQVAPKIEYWIEYGITEQFTTVDDLVERVSFVAWECDESRHITRFFKEFRDAPHRSERMRSFVDDLAIHIIRWFAIAAADNFASGYDYTYNCGRRSSYHRSYDHSFNWDVPVTPGGGWIGFPRAASFVGHLIECGLLGHDIVRRHLIKPLIAHHDYDNSRAEAIYNLFVVAGNTLLQGLLEPGDVQVCLETLGTYCASAGEPKAAKLNELREIHTTWLQRREDEQRGGVVETEEANGVTAEVPTEIETPIAFVPQELPNTAIDIDAPPPTSQTIVPPSILQAIELPSILRDTDSFPGACVEVPTGTPSSPTLSISTISDFTPSELDGDTGEGSGERTIARHETFYLENGDVEIVCGHTLFRVHSTTVSFSSQKLRDILSRSALLRAPMPEGCPRISVTDTAQDFAVLLKMIHTPGFPAWPKVPEFTVFASLLRMTTKYGFSDVREQLVHGIKGAYPTKWEGFEAGIVLGEDIFGSSKPHPNAVWNLFAEQGVKFALPFAAYRAAMGGFSSLICDEPGAVLSRLMLASAVNGMERMWDDFAELAYSAVCNTIMQGCHDTACAMNVGVNPPDWRDGGLSKIYETMVKDRKNDRLSSLSLGNIVCANCAKTVEMVHWRWRSVTWNSLPRMFGVGKNWEEL